MAINAWAADLGLTRSAAEAGLAFCGRKPGTAGLQPAQANAKTTGETKTRLWKVYQARSDRPGRRTLPNHAYTSETLLQLTDPLGFPHWAMSILENHFEGSQQDSQQLQ
jgi:hypothetical protein